MERRLARQRRFPETISTECAAAGLSPSHLTHQLEVSRNYACAVNIVEMGDRRSIMKNVIRVRKEERSAQDAIELPDSSPLHVRKSRRLTLMSQSQAAAPAAAPPMTDVRASSTTIADDVAAPMDLEDCV